jgi:starch phosphorylase
MLTEYLQNFYVPATRQGARLHAEEYRGARQLAAWKARIRQCWSSVNLRRLDSSKRNIWFGESIALEVAVQLNGLKPEDVMVEVLVQRDTSEPHLQVKNSLQMKCLDELTERGEHRFQLEVTPEMCGKLEYRIRVYPYHELLAHPFEMGMMRWL